MKRYLLTLALGLLLGAVLLLGVLVARAFGSTTASRVPASSPAGLARQGRSGSPAEPSLDTTGTYHPTQSSINRRRGTGCSGMPAQVPARRDHMTFGKPCRA